MGTNDREPVLSCDSPQCNSPIEEGHVLYDRSAGEIYHPGLCIVVASVQSVFESGEPAAKIFETITFYRALQLSEEGESKQSSELEGSVEGESE
jgi:hypothetical protein